MTRRKFSKLLKPVAMLSTVLSAGVVLSIPAMAQTESQVETSQEIELSPDAFEILCERSPLNSRCEGGAAEARDTGDITSPSDRIEQRTDPDTDPIDAVRDPSEAPVNPDSEGTPDSPYEMQQPGTTTSPSSRLQDRVDPEETDPANAVRDPAEAPVNPASEGTSTPSYEMQQDSGATVTPEEGSVAPKQMTETPTAPDAAAPASPTTGTTAAPETSAPAASISESELQQFAEAVPQLQAIERTTQQEVVQTIEESGFSRERFSQLYQQQTSGSAIEPAPTAEEEENFTQAYSNIQKIQQDAQSEREQIIEAQGLEPQRFDQILAAVLQDPALQQQVQSMMAQ